MAASQLTRVAAEQTIIDPSASYEDDLVGLLYEQLLSVIRTRQPDIEQILEGKQDIRSGSNQQILYILETYGIWFQLLSIAEQNAMVQQRRQIEK